MSTNKKSEESTSPPDNELEQKVDAMMDSTLPSTTGAPAVPRELLKDAGIKTPKAKIASAPAAEPVQAVESIPTAVPEVEGKEATELDDPKTDKAVSDIVAQEGDEVLAAEDLAADRNKLPVKTSKSDWKARLGALAHHKVLLASVAVILIFVFALPVSRNAVLGLIIKRSINVKIVDSTTHTPVTNAEVVLDGHTAKANADGSVHLKAGPGKTSLVARKQYYKNYSSNYAVSLTGSNNQTIKLVATGRQVPIIIRNTITGQPLSGVEIKALDTTAKTNKSGKALLVLPASATKTTALIQNSGYNDTTVTVNVTEKAVPENNYKLTPSGRVYFLSNASGTLDVVRTNLDGTNRQVVFAGTGKEDQRNTSLLASRDWRYLVLKARHDGTNPALFLIDTATNKVTQFDSGTADFNLIGWYNHTFVYDMARTITGVAGARDTLKSYDAERGELNQLDQGQSDGTDTLYGYQTFSNFYIVKGAIVYSVTWNTYNKYFEQSYDLGGKSNSIRAVQASGQGKKDYQSFAAGKSFVTQAAVSEPNSVYYAVYSSDDNKTMTYEFQDQKVALNSTFTADNFNNAYPTYLFSPSGNKTFWDEPRDGKSTLFLGDQDGKSKKQIASASEYSTYGWYSDNYLLLSKDESELYIVPTGNISSKQVPLKISDYYKPAINYAGYGYGYGGL